MELRNENQEAGANNNENLSESSHKTGELFIEKEKFNEDVVDDESDSNIESWGVYFQGKDKTILGLFWDYKLAELFLDSVKKSDFLKKIKETV